MSGVGIIPPKFGQNTAKNTMGFRQKFHSNSSDQITHNLAESRDLIPVKLKKMFRKFFKMKSLKGGPESNDDLKSYFYFHDFS